MGNTQTGTRRTSKVVFVMPAEGGVYIVSVHRSASPSSDRQAGLTRGWGSFLVVLGMLNLGLGGLSIALHTSSPGFPSLWTGVICCGCGVSGRAAATAWYSPKVVHLHLTALPITLLAVVSSTVLSVIGLEDASRDGLILSLNLILTSVMAATIILLAASPALHLTLGLALRDPEFEGRVRRGELAARILVIIGGKLGPGSDLQKRDDGVGED